MTAMMMPPTMPMTIAPTVPMMVPFQSPSMTGVCCMISSALAKFHVGFVTNELIIIADEHDDHGERDPAPGVPDRPGVDDARPVALDGRVGHRRRQGLTAKLLIAPASTASTS